MKKIAFAAALLIASQAYAGSLTSTNTDSTNSAATAQNQASPTQVLEQVGTRQVGNAPALAVGGSIGSHICEASAGGSGGWFSGSAGIVITYSRQSCVFLNVYDGLQQAAANEDKDGYAQQADNLRDASYELLAEIDPKVRAVLSRNHVIHGQAAVQSDDSGTVGLQPQNYRVDAVAKAK
jgi:hypothetical protein